MKKLLFAIAFMTAGSVAVLAQEAQPQEPQTPPSTEIQLRRHRLLKFKARIKIKDKLLHQVNYLLTFKLRYKEPIIAVGR